MEQPNAETEQPERMGVKFSNNVFLHESFLVKHNVAYTQDDLEDSPMGRCHVIRNTQECNHEMPDSMDSVARF